MKITSKITITTIFLLIFFAITGVGSVMASDSNTETGDKIIVGDSFYLPEGKTLDGRLIVFIGSATLEEGSTVTGDVILTSSDLEASGNILGSVISVGGGQVQINDSARVSGDVITVASILERSDGAVIHGDIVGTNPGSIPSSIPNIIESGLSDLWSGLNPLWDFVGDIFKGLILSGLAALVVLIFPKPTQRVGQTFLKNPLLSGVFGLLTIVIYPFAILICIATLILIPVIPLILLSTVFIFIWGWIIVGVELGQKIVRQFHWSWSEPLVAALGVFILTLLVNALGWLSQCCLEFPIFIVICSLGLGSIILSRFGKQVYVNTESTKE